MDLKRDVLAIERWALEAVQQKFKTLSCDGRYEQNCNVCQVEIMLESLFDSRLKPVPLTREECVAILLEASAALEGNQLAHRLKQLASIFDRSVDGRSA